MLDLTLEAGERIESKLDIDVHEIDTAVAFSFGAFGPALFLVGVACLLRLFCWPRVKRVCARACPSLCHDDAGYRVASELTAADEWAKMIEDNQNPKPPPKEQETPLAGQEEEETTDEEEDDGEEEESEGEEEEESEDDEEESEEEEEEPPPPPRWRVKPAPLPKRRVEKPPIKIDPALEEWGRTVAPAKPVVAERKPAWASSAKGILLASWTATPPPQPPAPPPAPDEPFDPDAVLCTV